MYNVEPTLNDHDVMQFIHNGVTLENVIDPGFNRECETIDRGHLHEFVQTDS